MTVALRLVETVDVEADAEAPPEARRARRSRVMLAATMTTAATDVPVVIRDISSSGALVTSPTAPVPGSWVTLRRDPVCVHAQVMWRDGRKLGLAFRDLIDEAALLVCLSGKPKAVR